MYMIIIFNYKLFVSKNKLMYVYSISLLKAHHPFQRELVYFHTIVFHEGKRYQQYIQEDNL